MVTLEPEVNTVQKLITAEEAAEYFHVSLRTVRQWISSGKLSASKIGKYYFIKEQDIDTFLDANRVEPGDEEKDE